MSDKETTPDVTLVPTTIHVMRTTKIGGEDEKQEDGGTQILEVHRFATTPAMMGVSYPLKVAQNYCSAGIVVTVQRPCYWEEREEALQEAKDTAVAFLRKQFQDVVNTAHKLASAKPTK